MEMLKVGSMSSSPDENPFTLLEILFILTVGYR